MQVIGAIMKTDILGRDKHDDVLEEGAGGGVKRLEGHPGGRLINSHAHK